MDVPSLIGQGSTEKTNILDKPVEPSTSGYTGLPSTGGGGVCCS